MSDNPYAAALDGLEIADPVRSFFDFCRERETIRSKREGGEASPWSEDPIFQKGRFLNTFREDDKGSRAVMRFCEALRDDFSDLVHGLFFCRWCNLASTLDALDPGLLKKPNELRRFLLEELPQPWSSEVYPVVPLRWEGKEYDRLRAVTELFPKIVGFLVKSIKEAKGDVVRATAAINGEFAMSNDFPIFMAVIDVSWFRPDVIDPESPVPTGIGAAPYLDVLQKHLGLADHHETCQKMIELQAEYWPEARRGFNPIDIEYLSCECRKYFSYVNGTKKFEGKNLFKAR